MTNLAEMQAKMRDRIRRKKLGLPAFRRPRAPKDEAVAEPKVLFTPGPLPVVFWHSDHKLPGLETHPWPPDERCVAHWDRRSESVRAARAGLCPECFRGVPLLPNEHARPLKEAVARLCGKALDYRTLN